MNLFCIPGVGKTSLVRRYTENKWNPAGTATTTGAFFVTHKTDFKGTRVKLQIWDTAGKFFVLPRTQIVAVALLWSAILPVWGVSPPNLDGLLMLGSPRPARVLAHRQTLTPSGSLPALPVEQHCIECAEQIRGFKPLHSSTLSQNMPRVYA
jgi:hypothetical protein